MGDCVEIFEKTSNDDRRVYMHVHSALIQVWVNDHLVYESPTEPTKEEIEAEKALDIKLEDFADCNTKADVRKRFKKVMAKAISAAMFPTVRK